MLRRQSQSTQKVLVLWQWRSRIVSELAGRSRERHRHSCKGRELAGNRRNHRGSGAGQEQSEGEGAQPHREGAGQKRGALQAVEGKKYSQQTEMVQRKQGEELKQLNQLLKVEPGLES